MRTNDIVLCFALWFGLAAWIWAIPCQAQTGLPSINRACILHYTVDNIPQMFILNNGRSLNATLVVDKSVPLSVAGSHDCTTAVVPGPHTIVVDSSDGRQDQTSFTLGTGYNEICSLMDDGLECHPVPLITGQTADQPN